MKPFTGRLPNKGARDRHRLLLKHGYQLAGTDSGGHFVYVRDEFETITVPGTPRVGNAGKRLERDLRKRHPEQFPRVNVKPARERRSRAARRVPPRPAMALHSVPERPITPTVVEVIEVPDPGSPDAMNAGCWCPVFANRHGRGVEGRDGIFEIVVGCPVHEPREAA